VTLIPCHTLGAMILVTKKLVEGYFVITTDELIFEVKGIIHPRNRIIAYLRYAPATNERHHSNIDYRKIYALDEREDFLRNRYPSYLWFSETHGRIMQSVPKDKIKSVYNPVEYLASLRTQTETATKLGRASVKLSEKLVEVTDIDWSDIGITGSQLVGTEREDSDIDLVVYGFEACRRFYSELAKNIKSIKGVERYSGFLLDEHVNFRWGKHNDLRNTLKEIERKKVLQGLFEGYHFFVRLVRNPNDLDFAYGDVSFQEKGQRLVSGKIVNDSESIFTPCEYVVECVNPINLRKLVSYRGRFTEQVSNGMDFEAKGRLETVIDHKKNLQYFQLVLGESPTDYLIPK